MTNKLLKFCSIFGVFAVCGLFALSSLEDKDVKNVEAEDVYFESLQTGVKTINMTFLNGYTGSYKTGFELKYYSNGEAYYVTINNSTNLSEESGVSNYHAFKPFNYGFTEGFNVNYNGDFYNYFAVSPAYAYQNGNIYSLSSGGSIYFVTGELPNYVSNNDFTEFQLQTTDNFSIPFNLLDIYLTSFDRYYDDSYVDFPQRLKITYKFVFSNDLGSYNYYFNYDFGIVACDTSNPYLPVASSYSFMILQEDVFIGSYTFNLADKPEDYINGYNTGYTIGFNDGSTQGYNNAIKENQIAFDNGYAEGVASQQSLLWSKYQEGYAVGYQNGSSEDETVSTIFSNILLIGMLPVDFFLSILNFEFLGINLMSFVSALLSVAITIIVIRIITGKKNG